jgi:hypothetical protein
LHIDRLLAGFIAPRNAYYALAYSEFARRCREASTNQAQADNY